MNLAVLRLLQLLNAPADRLQGQRCVALEQGQGAGQLVLDGDLARAILKHPQARPFDLWGYYLALTKLKAADLPHLSAYFAQGPLLRDGADHAQMRRALMPLYQRLEQRVRDDFAGQIAAFAAPRDHHALAADVADALFDLMLGAELGLAAADLPRMPGRLFSLLPRRAALIAREAELATYSAQIAAALAAQNKPAQMLWPLVTLGLMGHDALRCAVLFALTQPSAAPNDASLRQIAPVGVLPRQFTQDVQIADQQFLAGQIAYICPYLLHETGAAMSFAFGAGPHHCPGQRIADAAWQAVQAHLPRWRAAIGAAPKLRWQRDLLLNPRMIA